MKFVLAPYGSRGDVDPILAVGSALKGRGHEVVLCGPPDFAEPAEGLGVSFLPVGPEFRTLFDGARGNDSVFLESLSQAPAQLSTLRLAATGADLILGAALQFAGPTVAQQLAIPYVYAIFSPMYLRSVELPPMAFDAARLPALLHRALWYYEDATLGRHAAWLNSQRAALGLSRIRSLHRYLVNSGSVIGAFDPVFAPVPSDVKPDVVTGAWRVSTGKVLSTEVNVFLDSGPAPLFIGFGSMQHSDSQATMEMLVQTAISEGFRVVVGQGWSRLKEMRADSLLLVGDVPYELLFPRMCAVVHHGGAGTTTAAALAGVPQLVVPHLGDQFYHARRTVELGVGVQPVPLHLLNRERFATRLRQLSGNVSLASRARDVAQQMTRRAGATEGAIALENLALVHKSG